MSLHVPHLTKLVKVILKKSWLQKSTCLYILEKNTGYKEFSYMEYWLTEVFLWILDWAKV